MTMLPMRDVVDVDARRVRDDGREERAARARRRSSRRVTESVPPPAVAATTPPPAVAHVPPVAGVDAIARPAGSVSDERDARERDLEPFVIVTVRTVVCPGFRVGFANALLTVGLRHDEERRVRGRLVRDALVRRDGVRRDRVVVGAERVRHDVDRDRAVRAGRDRALRERHEAARPAVRRAHDREAARAGPGAGRRRVRRRRR